MVIFHSYVKLPEGKQHIKPPTWIFTDLYRWKVDIFQTSLKRSLNPPASSNPGWWLSHPSEKYEFVSWDDSSQ